VRHPASGPASRSAQALFAALCASLALAGGCSGSGGDNSAPTPGAADFLPTMAAALSEGQLTFNNRWTQADLDAAHVRAAISYEGLNQPAGRVRPYTLLVQEYRARREQCEEDFNELYPPTAFKSQLTGRTYHIQDRKCYPALTDRPYSVQEGILPGDGKILHRSGYYGGGGFPPVPTPETSRFRAGTPEPLDPSDYCSRLHDEQAWGQRTLTFHPSECGIVMCLSKASGLPADVMAKLPDVEAARQFWYNGAASLCGGNQANDAPPPVLGP
jgi:hypothetical protein